MPILIRHGEPQRLANGSRDADVHRDAAQRRAVCVERFRTLHEHPIVDLEDTIVLMDRRGQREGDCHTGRCFRHAPAGFITQLLNRRCHASADLHPYIDLIANSKPAGKPQADQSALTREAHDPADQQAAIIGTAIAHHGAPGASLEIGRREIAIENLGEPLLFLRACLIIAPLLLHAAIECLPIRLNDRGDILRTFHAALDFQRSNAGREELGQNLKRVHILGREQIFARRSAEDILSRRVYKRIRQPTRLRAAPAIAAAPPDHAAHEALSGIADTECTMHERLDLERRMCGDIADLG